MGRLIDLITKIRALDNTQLLERFKHIVQAQSVRDYLATKEDHALTVEVRLTGEEIINRMSIKN